ncbi:MAG: hypothetical protein L0H59_11295 [Tomitella sp.]|nr:hypothetical protein [Tomitella sp.]
MTVPGRDSFARPNRRDTARRTRGRKQSVWEILLGVLVLLAIIASIIMIFTDSVPLLRIGLVAALWAAVVGAIAMTKFRKDSENDSARARDLKLVYELQLEREIAARREYELVVETQVRRQVEERVRDESSEEIESLRQEMAALRVSLEALFDGELPDERLAVRAESHRLQELAGGPGQMVAAQAAELPEIDDVVAVAPEEPASEDFEPDYDAYREAAQSYPPGVTGDDAPVTAETQVIPDGADEDGSVEDGTVDDGSTYDQHDPDDAYFDGDVDADSDFDDADADVDVAEDENYAAEYGSHAAVDEDGSDDDEVATAPAGVYGSRTAEAGDESDAAEDDAAEGHAAEDDAAEDDAAEDDDEQSSAEHSTRPGGNSVAELLARMRESGSLPENLGQRRRRAQD